MLTKRTQNRADPQKLVGLFQYLQVGVTAFGQMTGSNPWSQLPSPIAKVCQLQADLLGTSEDNEGVMNSSWEAECIRDSGFGTRVIRDTGWVVCGSFWAKHLPLIPGIHS